MPPLPDPTATPHVPRIFLSLSASDASFVQKVEQYLLHGLAFIYTSSFHTGDDLISTMERHVRSSWIFVLFASEESLDSQWVNFEIDQARLANITRPDHRILVFPASKTIQSGDLPAWMRRYWFEAEGRNAKDIARYINNQVRFGLLQQRVYGRGKIVDAATSRFSRHIAQTGVVPNVFFFSGLHNIGRTTFARKLFSEVLPQHRQVSNGPFLDLTDREDIANFYRSLREHIDDDFSVERFTADREYFDKLAIHERQVWLAAARG